MRSAFRPRGRLPRCLDRRSRVYREEILPGAVFTRVAASHIRVGTFQYLRRRR